MKNINTEFVKDGMSLSYLFTAAKSSLNQFKRNFSGIIKEAKKHSLLELFEIVAKDLFYQRTLLGWIYLIGLSSIPILFEMSKSGPVDWMGLWTSVTGVICVILVTEGRASNYIFGLINSIIYLLLALKSGFYGEVLTTLYFAVCQPVGLYIWLNNRINEQKVSSEKNQFKSKSLGIGGWIKYLALTVVIWLGMGFAYQSIGSQRPFRDSITDGTNGVGQLLMNGLYWEQWLFWIATNLFSIYLWWGNGGNAQMVVMYLVYTLNSVVGWYHWKKASDQTGIILEKYSFQKEGLLDEKR